ADIRRLAEVLRVVEALGLAERIRRLLAAAGRPGKAPVETIAAPQRIDVFLRRTEGGRIRQNETDDDNDGSREQTQEAHGCSPWMIQSGLCPVSLETELCQDLS